MYSIIIRQLESFEDSMIKRTASLLKQENQDYEEIDYDLLELGSKYLIYSHVLAKATELYGDEELNEEDTHDHVNQMFENAVSGIETKTKWEAEQLVALITVCNNMAASVYE